MMEEGAKAPCYPGSSIRRLRFETFAPCLTIRGSMLKLSAFADEIGPDLDEQIRVCKQNAVTHFELRGVYGKNVMDFGPELRAEIKTKLHANGMAVISIGSPIGKVA